MLRDMREGREERKPHGVIPVVTGATDGTTEGLQITWYGHSSALVEIDGDRVLFDPVWSERCSPSRLVGPRRLHPPPVAARGLPPVDAIVISHDHYDHLDMPTIRALLQTQDAPFVVPLGVGAHLIGWGVPVEPGHRAGLGPAFPVAGLTLTATEARHFSGRAFPATRRCGRRGSWRGRRARSSTPATRATSTATRASAPRTVRST